MHRNWVRVKTVFGLLTFRVALRPYHISESAFGEGPIGKHSCSLAAGLPYKFRGVDTDRVVLLAAFLQVASRYRDAGAFLEHRLHCTGQLLDCGCVHTGNRLAGPEIPYRANKLEKACSASHRWQPGVHGYSRDRPIAQSSL